MAQTEPPGAGTPRRPLTHLLDHSERQAMPEDTCSIESCSAPRRIRGWCRTHYNRWRSTGDPEKVRRVARSASPICSVSGCGRPHKARGFCTAHHQQALLAEASTCSIEGCDRRTKANGLCGAHNERSRTHGDPGNEPIGAKPRRWSGPRVGYGGLHARLRNTRGKASGHSCNHCGGPALQWAYDHSDPDPRVDRETGLEYSLDLSRYVPLCASCHKVFDLQYRPQVSK